MKRLLIIFCSLYCVVANAQFNPSSHVVVNDAIGQAQAAPVEGRGMFWDAGNFVWRDYQSTAEAIATLNLLKYRFGHFPVYVHSGGTLNGNGTYTGGTTIVYWWKTDLTDGSLVRWYTDSTASGGSFFAIANNLSEGVPLTMRSNLGLGSMATQNIAGGGDLTGNWPNITVSQFAGLPPSYYLSYANLTGKPVIPPQINITDAGQFQHTGTYPNLVFNSILPGFEQTLLKLNTVSQVDSINIGSFVFRVFGTSALGLPRGNTAQRPGSPSVGDTRWNTDSLALESWSGSAWVHPTGGGGGGSGITALTGDGTASGTGSVPFTLATVNTNVFGSNTFLKFATNGKGLTTSAVAVGGGDIIGALGYTPYNATNPNGYISSVSIFNGGSGQGLVYSLDSVKSLFANTPLSLDIVTNAHAITIKVDTTNSITGLTTLYENGLKQNLVTLTTTGFASPTFNQGTGALNIPNYGADTINAITGLTTLYQNSLKLSVVNIGAVQNATTYSITNSGGTGATLNVANATHAGLIDSARWFLVDSIYRGLKVLNVFVANGLTQSNGDSLYWGGTLLRNTTIDGSNAFSLTLDSMKAQAGKGFKINFGSDAGWDLFTKDSATGFWTRIPKGTPGQSLQMLSAGGIGFAAQTGTGGGPDSAVLAGFGMTKVVASTNITLNVDSTKFTTLWNEFKNSAGSDTLIRLCYGIPEPDVTGSTTNGTPILWKFLTSGGGHTLSPDLDSCIFVNASGHLLIGFPTAQGVAGAVLAGDEQTYPLSVMGIIGNQDNYEFIGHIAYSGLGIQYVGSGSGGLWNIQHSTLEGWTATIDTSTQGILSFDLTDPAGQFLGAPNDQTQVIYNGANAGFHFVKAFTGLTRGYKFFLCDAFGDTVRNYSPQATDRITISNGSQTWQSIDFRQFLTATNPYLASGLPNFWFLGVYRAFPDSLKIIRPPNFAAVASGTAGQINTAWTAVANAANFYELDRSTQQNFAANVTVLVNFTNVTSFNDTGLTTGTKYWYRLRASRVANVYSGWEERGPITAP
jgi:hypothetical protein